MRTTCGDRELGRSESTAPERDNRCEAAPSGISAHPPEKTNDAAADMQRLRIDALRAIDEGDLSCVAGLACGPACSLYYAAATIVSKLSW
jgi:hypothetical protein